MKQPLLIDSPSLTRLKCELVVLLAVVVKDRLHRNSDGIGDAKRVIVVIIIIAKWVLAAVKPE